MFEKVGVSGETKIKVKRQKAICVCGITVRVKSIFKNNLSKTLIFKTENYVPTSDFLKGRIIFPPQLGWIIELRSSYDPITHN